MSDIDERDDWMDDPDLAPTEEELAEAGALAHALARGTAKGALPEDAFETAGLVSFAHDGGAIADETLARILEGVFEEARPRPVEAPAPWWRRWVIPLGFASAASVTVVLFAVLRGPALPSAPLALPAPDAALLRAQAAAATGSDRDALDTAMGAYRGTVLAALEDRYAR